MAGLVEVIPCLTQSQILRFGGDDRAVRYPNAYNHNSGNNCQCSMSKYAVEERPKYHHPSHGAEDDAIAHRCIHGSLCS
jgi:hypothetical protein